MIMNKYRALHIGSIVLFIVSFVAMNLWCAWVALGGFPSTLDQVKFICKMIFFYGATASIFLNINTYIAIAFVILNGIISFIILDWHHYLGSILTVKALRSSFSYDLAGNISVLNYIDFNVTIICMLLLAVQCICFTVHFRSIRRKRPVIAWISMGLLCCFLFAYSLRHMTPPWKFGEWSLEASIERRGYLMTWFAELCDAKDYRVEQTCTDAKIKSLPLFPVEDKIIVVQVECLDYLLVNYTIKNRLLMPTLSAMAEKGLLFRVDGIKKLASSNSDYELLNTRVANPMEVFYSFVKNYPDSFASFFSKEGFQTSVYAGYSGTFANARTAYQRMGTEYPYFLEELQEQGLPLDPRALRQKLEPQIDDRVVFAFAGDKLPPDHFFSVLITMNMHDPKEGFELPEFIGEKHAESYTVIRETDDAFKVLLEKVPDGTTLVVIGDHTPYHGPRSRHVPCLFYKKGEDISALSRQVSADTVYTRCEISQYIRRLFDMPAVSSEISLCPE